MGKDTTSENVHIPRYIKNQPWFYQDTKKEEAENDYLVHHRQLKKGGALDIDNNSEPKLGLGIKDEFETVQVVRTSKRGGNRCGNCGSVGHSRRDCLERARKVPRLVGDTGGVISVRKEADGSLDWDARKDRWFGYTGKEYDEVLKKWENRRETATQADEEWWDTDEEVELTKLGLYKDTGGVLRAEEFGNTKLQRASVRLREDRAAYLNDLNAEEIKYDPKSRLYKTESLGSVDEESKMFRRHLTGEGKALDELNRFTRAHARKEGIRDEIESDAKVKHVLIANPTKYERMLKQEQSKEPPKVGKITDLEARKSTGTAQSAQTKQELKDLYG
ncbi:hypothetical protein HG537_0G03140 [Torulaspora globosa]|uniref:Pre-mRNA-splicing factor SLU7 n=1 Tax=Torulaspora globosa TaxID=48254 RepID=A0A7H9HY53_9SACH|nr:hypothetical protein HG537_0G03140 [Torulaspora sp. CBS 2947]